MQISQFYGHNDKMARTKIYTEQNKNTQNNNTAFRKNYFVVFFVNHSGNWRLCNVELNVSVVMCV